MNVILFNRLPLKLNSFICVVSLLVFALLIKLAFWQLGRAEHKELRLDQMRLYQDQESTDLRDVLALQASDEELNDMPVSLAGTFTHGQAFLLDNQVYKGRLGYQVVQVFDDVSSGLTVLINLGWVLGSIDRAFIPEIKEISGQVSFKGKIRIVEQSILLANQALSKETWPQRIQSIEIQKISALLNRPLVPFMVYVNNDDRLGYEKDWIPVVMPPEKHRAYAVQWFVLAFVWLALMLSAAYSRAKVDQ